jgi:hypothetical protein
LLTETIDLPQDALQAKLLQTLNYGLRIEKGGRNPLEFRSIFLHAWDVASIGADPLVEWALDTGLNTLCLAGNYHSGWFIHPQHPQHRLHLTEGSVCYFHPQESLYKETRLKPQMSQLCRKRDWFASAAKAAERHNLQLVSWAIGTHNSTLVAKFPELTQQNVYGDRLPFALCPAQAEVAAYLEALCRDIATNFPVWALQLECFGWMGARHGHHHERDLVGLSEWETQLLSTCFCPACEQRARAARVDVSEVKGIVRQTLEAAFQAAPTRPRGYPKSMAELEGRSPPVRRYNNWREEFARSVIKRIRTHALKGTNCRLLLETGWDDQLAEVVDGFACIAYRASPQRTLGICRDATHIQNKKWSGLMQCLVQLGMGVPRSEKELQSIVRAVAQGGCNGINFYNRSESPPTMLNWLSKALKEFAA